jgi:hypothetical protein
VSDYGDGEERSDVWLSRRLGPETKQTGERMKMEHGSDHQQELARRRLLLTSLDPQHSHPIHGISHHTSLSDITRTLASRTLVSHKSSQIISLNPSLHS